MSDREISLAVDILRRGGLVAFPTETVYGLGADATNPAAVARIFAAKGRPATNPLIIHVADESVARRHARRWPAAAAKLVRAFWPGPLTIILPRRRTITDIATAGLPTAGFRCPDHPLALEMLRRFGGPVAAPSANRSTRVSPTAARHVREELGRSVDFILDGGPCRVGIESTVLDLSGDRPVILRPGAVTAARIESVIGPVNIAPAAARAGPARSPGQQRRHYAPAALTCRFRPADAGRAARWCGRHAELRCAALAIATADAFARALPARHELLRMPRSPAAYARMLYSTLRRLDRRGIEVILIEMPPRGPEWLAVTDRIMRASITFGAMRQRGAAAAPKRKASTPRPRGGRISSTEDTAAVFYHRSNR